jgi:hypothetical protein
MSHAHTTHPRNVEYRRAREKQFLINSYQFHGHGCFHEILGESLAILRSRWSEKSSLETPDSVEMQLSAVTTGGLSVLPVCLSKIGHEP